MKKELEYNEPLTVRRLKKELENIPGDVVINVKNDEGDSTANIYVWFENLQTRQFVELMGFKPFWKMNDEEKKKCGFQ
jgi:transcriptional regulator of aromatic amino acid metabolism